MCGSHPRQNVGGCIDCEVGVLAMRFRVNCCVAICFYGEEEWG